MSADSRTTVQADIVAGSLSGLMWLPGAVAYGALVFAPLGHDAAAAGVVAGLVTMALLNLASAALRGTRTIIAGPSSLPTLVMSGAVLSFVHRGLDSHEIFALVTTAALLAALLQVGIAVSGLGEVVKFVPFPVRTGLLTGTAFLMVRGQLPAVLGTTREAMLVGVRPMAVAIAMVTIAAVWLTRRTVSQLPAMVAGLSVGTAAHFLLATRVDRGGMGPLIGDLPSKFPSMGALERSAAYVTDGHLEAHLPLILPLAVGLAVVASMESLVAVLASDGRTAERSNASRELMAQGVGNLVVAAFGGIIGAANPARSVANHGYGAVSTLSRAVAGLVATAVLLFFEPLLAEVPVAVLGALLFVLAFGLLDRWVVGTALSLLRGQERLSSVAASNLAIAATVIVVMLAVGAIEAVGLGLFLSVMYFVTRMGKQVVRRQYDGTVLHSNVQRPDEEFTLLESEGHRIAVIEVEGSLFFATADRLGRVLEELGKGEADFIVMDLRLAAELDLTSAEILKSAAARCLSHGAQLLISCEPDGAVDHQLEALGVKAAIGETRCFSSVNDALAHAEDRVLDEVLAADRYAVAWPLGKFATLLELDADELGHLGEVTQERRYQDGDVIFRQAEPAGSLYLLAKGRVQILAQAAHDPAPKKLAVLCPGTLLGELSLVDKKPRSADAVAEGDVVCHELGEADFAALLETRPALAVKILSGVAREIALRVRIANRTVR